jgi:MFS family permease
MVAMTIVYAGCAWPAGKLADRGHAKHLLAAGLAALVASDLVLAFAANIPGVLAGACLWGLHMALTQGLLSALVAATAPAELRGTAFGVFAVASGIALLVASALAGYLWQSIGPSATFFAGAAFAVIAGAGLATQLRDIPKLGGR